MDNTKRLIIATICAMVVLMGWEYWYSYYARTHLLPQTSLATTGPSTANSTAPASAAVAASGPTTSGVASSTTQGGPGTATSTASITAASAPANQLKARSGPTTQAIIGSTSPDYEQKKTNPYALGINLSSSGASIELVTVNEFRAEVGKIAPFTFQEPYPDAGDRGRSLVTRAVIVNGQRLDVQNTDWLQTAISEASVTYSLPLLDSAGKPLLDVNKTFALTSRSDPGGGYEVSVSYGLVSHVDRTLNVQLIFDGPNSMAPLNPRDYVQAVGAYPQGQRVRAVPYMVSSLKPDSPQSLTTDQNQPLLWAGISNTYFDALLRVAVEKQGPDSKGPAALEAAPLESVEAEGLAAEAPSTAPAAQSDDNKPPPRAVITFKTKALALGANGTTHFKLIAFFGPKDRGVLENAYYASFPRHYDETLVLVNRNGYFAWLCGLCTFQWLVTVLVTLLRWIHFVLRDWGLAIIALVVIVRLLLHPITKKSQVSMMRMQKMGPEIERLKKKYGDNKQELNAAMVGVYKEQGMAPLLGCAPMFLQMPIWIALWNALQSTFELWHAPFLWGFTWIKDLSQPDALYTFPHAIPLIFGWHLTSINLLPLMMVVVTWMNQKYMPKPMTTTPEQAQSQKMMQWMSMAFPLMFYAFPSGLNLYYVTSMGLGIVESKRIRAHIEEQEKLEKEQRVIVDAKPTRSSRRIAKDVRDEEKPTRRGRFANWVADLQRKADEVRREGERKNKRRS